MKLFRRILAWFRRRRPCECERFGLVDRLRLALHEIAGIATGSLGAEDGLQRASDLAARALGSQIGFVSEISRLRAAILRLGMMAAGATGGDEEGRVLREIQNAAHEVLEGKP